MDKKLWEALVDGVVEVTFTKKDGSIRTMNCTLHKAWLPGEVNESMEPTGEHTSVWSTADNGWRSFKNESVQTWRKME